jgi:hypothetical protein
MKWLRNTYYALILSGIMGCVESEYSDLDGKTAVVGSDTVSMTVFRGFVNSFNYITIKTKEGNTVRIDFLEDKHVFSVHVRDNLYRTVEYHSRKDKDNSKGFLDSLENKCKTTYFPALERTVTN